MRAKKKLNKFQKILRRCIFIGITLLIAVVVFFELTVRDRLELAIIAEIKTVSHSAINAAVDEYINENKYICDDLLRINMNDANQITSIYENSYYVNSFKTEITKKGQKYIEELMCVDGIDVKLGNFTGLTILSDVGPYIHFNIESTPTISCEILSSFESTGLNQTTHHIILDIQVDIYVGNPIRIESISFETKYEISQTVIIGTVPSTYGIVSRY